MQPNDHSTRLTPEAPLPLPVGRWEREARGEPEPDGLVEAARSLYQAGPLDQAGLKAIELVEANEEARDQERQILKERIIALAVEIAARERAEVARTIEVDASRARTVASKDAEIAALKAEKDRLKAADKGKDARIAALEREKPKPVQPPAPALPMAPAGPSTSRGAPRGSAFLAALEAGPQLTARREAEAHLNRDLETQRDLQRARFAAMGLTAPSCAALFGESALIGVRLATAQAEMLGTNLVSHFGTGIADHFGEGIAASLGTRLADSLRGLPGM